MFTVQVRMIIFKHSHSTHIYTDLTLNVLYTSWARDNITIEFSVCKTLRWNHTWFPQRILGRVKIFFEAYLFEDAVQQRFRTYPGHVQLVSRQMHLRQGEKCIKTILVGKRISVGAYLQTERLFERFRYAFNNRLALVSTVFAWAFRNDVHRPRI